VDLLVGVHQHGIAARRRHDVPTRAFHYVLLIIIL